jgi:two-component system, OmpR family, response regulator MprA
MSEASGTPSGRLRALVVDDDLAVRRVLTETLVLQGIDVVEAGNGIQALEAVAANTFDVIFMDIVMPEKDGIETIIDMRRQGISCRIIAISSHSKFGDMLLLEAARSVGANDFIQKPFNPHDLVAATKKMLSDARAAKKS